SLLIEHGLVGSTQHGRWLDAGLRSCNAEAGLRDPRHALDLDRWFEDRVEAVDDPARAVGSHAATHDHELVAAIAGDRVAWAHRRGEAGADLGEHRVADVVAVLI